MEASKLDREPTSGSRHQSHPSTQPKPQLERRTTAGRAIQAGERGLWTPSSRDRWAAAAGQAASAPRPRSAPMEAEKEQPTSERAAPKAPLRSDFSRLGGGADNCQMSSSR